MFFNFFRKKIHLRQVLQVAVFVETEGERFYRQLAEKIDDQNAREVCLRLADDEAAHRIVFEKYLSHWRRVRSKEEYIKPYLKRLNLQGVFSSPAFLNASVSDLLTHAIEYEEKTVEFYRSLEKDFPDTWKKMHVENIVLLEKEHVGHLRSIMSLQR